MTHGRFFSIDRRVWAELCGRGQVNDAAAYLVLAQGAAPGTATKWSVTALQKYTGIRWERGKATIDALIREGFLRQTGTREKPCYELASADEIARIQFTRKHDALTADEQLVIAEIRYGGRPERMTKSTRAALDKLRAGGIITPQGDGKYAIADPPAEPLGRDPIWLPNSIVVGAKSGDDSPVRRLRMAGDLWALQLLIDLYGAHNLRDDGGIHPRLLRGVWQRKLVGEQGIHQVWAFHQDSRWLNWDGPFTAHKCRPATTGQNHPVWETIEHLERQGLLVFVPHLWTDDPSSSEHAEIIHPCGTKGHGEPIEIEMGTAAHLAGLAMAPEWKLREAQQEGYTLLAPIERTIPNVQMVGVARLRYRPHTKRTSQWYGGLMRDAQHWLEHYRGLLERAKIAQPQAFRNQELAGRC